MKAEFISTDDTHIKNVGNPSGLKKASGDSSSGVDAATINAVAMNLVVNGMVDLSAIQMIERSTQSHLNNTNLTSVSATQKTEQRSQKINELALGMQSGNFKSTKVDSLGDLMCELMVLMIQSTSERRKMEREERTLLVSASKEQAEVIAKEILEKMNIDVERSRNTAIGNAAVAGFSFAASSVTTMLPTKGKSFVDIQSKFGIGQTIGQLGQVADTATNLSMVNLIKESASLEADISKKRTMMALTKSVASSVESSLSSIDSAREFFMSMMSQIAQAEHDAKMQIIRNSVI